MQRTTSLSRPLTRTRRLLLIAVALAGVVSACSGDDGSADDVEAAAPDVVGAQIATAQTALGEVLVDPAGLTLYAFTDDVEGTSTCFDSCANAWPPVDGDLPVADGLEAIGFDAITRPDGSVQLRLAGRWPLYTFAGDAGPGDVNGQASAGVWFAVASDGTLVGLDETAPVTETTTPDTTADTTTDTTAGDTSADAGEVVTTELGDVLSNADGLTVYAFVNDVPGESNCLDPCSQTWPPVEEGSVLNPAPADDRLSVIERPDGIQQVALDGQPLYTFVDDLAAGDVNGQGVGDVWFAVSAEGEVLVPPTVRVGSTDAGNVLIDPEGFTVYTFVNDRPGVSTCDDPCSTTWPPVPGDTPLGATLDPAQFNQITRSDGTSQLTFQDQPLYRFTGDENPGDANGVLVGEEGTWAPVPTDSVSQLTDGDATTQVAAPAVSSDIQIVETELGHVLADANGRTLYGFLNDTATESACNDACADAWPPISGDVAIDPSVLDGATTSTLTRADGSTQLVIGTWPAYTFAGDGGPGDTNGQGSGDVWFAIAPDGSLIR